jgi:DNA-nicking Smr family endonuclease
MNNHGVTKESIKNCLAHFDRKITVKSLMQKVNAQDRYQSFVSEVSAQSPIHSMRNQSSVATSPGEHRLTSTYFKQNNLSTKSDKSVAVASCPTSKDEVQLGQQNHKGQSEDSVETGRREEIERISSPNAKKNKNQFGRLHCGINWSMPSFPNCDTNDVVMMEVTQDDKRLRNSYSQTERHEFLRGSIFEPELAIIELFSQEPEYQLCQRSVIPPVFLDKSTITDSLEMDSETKLQQMKKIYPDYPEDQLRAIFEACDFDHEWALGMITDMEGTPTFLLDDEIDWGEMIFADEDVKPDTHIEVKKEADSFEHDETPTADSPVKALDRESDEESGKFQIMLDRITAGNLEREFGSVLGYEYDYLKFPIPKSLAKQVFDVWLDQAKLMKLQKEKEESTKKMTQQLQKTDLSRGLRNVVASTSRSSTTSDTLRDSYERNYFGEREPSNFEQVMQEEEVMEASRESYVREAIQKKNRQVVKNEMKKAQLYDKYPGYDRQILDDVLEDNGYDVSSAMAVIQQIMSSTDVIPSRGEYLQSLYKTKGQFLPSVHEKETPFMKATRESDAEYDRKTIREMKKELERLRGMSDQMTRKSVEVYRKKHLGVAAYYRREAQAYREQSAAKASTIIAIYLQSLYDSNEVDLHGFNVADSLEVVRQFIEMKRNWMSEKGKTNVEVTIITGWGSKTGGDGRIKPSVQNFLQTSNLEFHPENKGCFRVFLYANK